jgi:hypothetical protein
VSPPRDGRVVAEGDWLVDQVVTAVATRLNHTQQPRGKE